MENNRPLGWTTLEEAKKLVDAGLDPNTADMRYEENNYELLDEWVAYPFGGDIKDFDVLKKEFPDSEFYPCWSLGALLRLIPKNIKVNDVNFHFFMSYDNTNKWSAAYESAFFKRRFFYSLFPNQNDLLINVIHWLLNNNHIKKQE